MPSINSGWGAADADVYKFLRYFTFLSLDDIAAIEESDRKAEGRPQAQKILAQEVTRLIHGEEGLQAAERITEALFSGSLEQLGEGDLEQLKQDGLPSSELSRAQLGDKPLTQWLVDAGMAASGKQVKDALGRGAVFINGDAISFDENLDSPACFNAERARFGRFYIVKLGKKKYHLFDVA